MLCCHGGRVRGGGACSQGCASPATLFAAWAADAAPAHRPLSPPTAPCRPGRAKPTRTACRACVRWAARWRACTLTAPSSYGASSWTQVGGGLAAGSAPGSALSESLRRLLLQLSERRCNGSRGRRRRHCFLAPLWSRPRHRHRGPTVARAVPRNMTQKGVQCTTGRHERRATPRRALACIVAGHPPCTRSTRSPPCRAGQPCEGRSLRVSATAPHHSLHPNRCNTQRTAATAHHSMHPLHPRR